MFRSARLNLSDRSLSLFALLAACWVTWLPLEAHAQVGRAMNAVAGSAPASGGEGSSGSRGSSRRSNPSTTNEVTALLAVVEAIGWIAHGAAWAVLAGSSWYHWDVDGRGYVRVPSFRDVPFAGGGGGVYANVGEGGQPVLAAFSVEGGVLLQGGARGRANLRLMLPFGFDVEAEYGVLGEPARSAVASVGAVAVDSQLVQLGAARVGYRLVDLDFLQMRIGGAARMWADSRNPVRFGGSIYSGLDAFIAGAVVLSIDGAFSSIGAASIWDARAAVGVMFDGFEIRAGYEHTAVEPHNGGQGAELSGPFIGTRLWW